MSNSLIFTNTLPYITFYDFICYLNTSVRTKISIKYIFLFWPSENPSQQSWRPNPSSGTSTAEAGWSLSAGCWLQLVWRLVPDWEMEEGVIWVRLKWSSSPFKSQDGSFQAVSTLSLSNCLPEVKVGS